MKRLYIRISMFLISTLSTTDRWLTGRRAVFGILALLVTLPAFGQNKYEVSGKIVDDTNQEPVPYAQVALYPPGETQPVTGAITADNGEFTLRAEGGKYELAVVFVGYEDKRISVNLTNSSKKLGAIALSPSTRQLEEIVVKGEQFRRPVSTDMEGLNINPDQIISNVGGSLLDILRNTPSVNVGDDGTVTIRGSSGTNVLIDGRNSALASDLEQIPASMIENIKIVNNPNAKYDAQGEGGVINIQLKRGEETGTTGKAEVTVGTRMRLNSSINLSHRSEQFNAFGGYSYRRWPRVGYSSMVRETYDDNQRLEQFGDSERQDNEHTFNIGGDYYFGKNKLSYEGAVNFEDESDNDLRNTLITDISTEEVLSQFVRQNTETEDNYTLDNALIYERLFDNKDQEFRALVSHSMRDQMERQFINVFTGSTTDMGELRGQERSTNDEANTTAIIQADYVHPFSNGKLEVGYKSTFRKLDNDYLYEVLDQSTDEWNNQTDISNHFLYRDQVHAAYAIYSHKFDKFDVSVGTRVEQTLVDTRLYNTNEENEQRYLDFFPSFQTQYHINDMNSVKFTYSRRIDRPGSWWLNPFPDISDSLNVRVGNPNIQPEYIHSLEFGHMISFKKADITSNLFYRHVDGQVDYIVTVEDGISYGRPTNLNTSQAYGLEIISTAEIFPWWSFNASYSIFRIQVDGTNLDADYTNKGLAWNTKLTTDFKLPFDIDFQLTGNYTAPEVEAQGRDLARYYVDASLQRSFLNDKGSVSLTLRDVFDTRNFSGESFGTNFSQTFEFKRESQIALLSVSYSF